MSDVTWEHNPPETLTSVPWKVTLHADGYLYVSCDIEELQYTLRIAPEVVLDLGNAIRRNEVDRILAGGKAK